MLKKQTEAIICSAIYPWEFICSPFGLTMATGQSTNAHVKK